jgi:histidine triad (HIT) family protein
MADDCLFCKIAAGQIPSQRVYSDDDVYAFRDINPCAPSHVLIIPRKHIARLTDATADDVEVIGKLMVRANDVAAREGLTEAGFRCVLNCGPGAGQIVEHVHVHLVGGRPLSWPPG